MLAAAESAYRRDVQTTFTDFRLGAATRRTLGCGT
jgi:hypothetical protein